MQQENVSAEMLGERLGLSRSGVSRILNEEGYSILIPHIETMCEFFQITPSELVADPGSLVQVVKPIESELLAHFRSMSEVQRLGLLSLLERKAEKPAATRTRYRPTQISAEQKQLWALFARSNAQAREGVLKILRGAAAAQGTTLGMTE